MGLWNMQKELTCITEKIEFFTLNFGQTINKIFPVVIAFLVHGDVVSYNSDLFIAVFHCSHAGVSKQ